MLNVLDFNEMDGLSNAQKKKYMNHLQEEVAVANINELIHNMTHKCFKMCIQKPGSALNATEQKCASLCMDRFMDAWNLVSRAYLVRLQKENREI